MSLYSLSRVLQTGTVLRLENYASTVVRQKLMPLAISNERVSWYWMEENDISKKFSLSMGFARMEEKFPMNPGLQTRIVTIFIF